MVDVMPKDCDVSVSICTYNRCTELRDALESVMCQQASGIRYEVIVVDNNSTDDTKQIVDSFVQSGHNNLRYVFEGRQGLSYARNTAISQARSPLLAFTDDDVRVSPDWVATIKRVFDKHSEVAYIGGKVLPRWPSPPPSWLTREQWSPMALADHGDTLFYTSLRRHTCLIGANLAIRREVLDRFGGFVPDLQRVRDGIGSMEDHELQLRLWKADQQGLYVPDLVVNSDVALERLRKNYHRRWHFGHGRFYALARIEEWEHSTVGWLFGVSSHLYKRALYDALGWCACVLRGNRTRAFDYETRLRFFAGFLSVHYKEFVEARERSHVAELSRFAWLATRRLFFGSNVRKAPENAQ
jgi:glycosyltransferase involved in cell wall biosynthesis